MFTVSTFSGTFLTAVAPGPLEPDLARRLQPEAARILSFGCSTGEELLAIRRRFAAARIVGAEINPRSRRIARRRIERDRRASVVAPDAIAGRFDIVFALAVLQVQPHRVAEAGIADLSPIYPFERFDAQLGEHSRPRSFLRV